VRGWLLEAAARIIEAAPHLTELDARIGDGDHGINLGRGMGVVRDGLEAPDASDDPAAMLRSSGRLLISSVGGASGPLYGTLFLDAAEELGSAADAAALARAVRLGAAGVGRRGRSTVGQKTMLDTLVPAAEALVAAIEAGLGLTVASERAVEAARIGRDSTRGMVAQRGRASYLGERAVGHLDPGAVSSCLLIEALDAAVRAVADGQLPASTVTSVDPSR
jgi:dihydroxyacetone kinase-like protein